MPKTDRSIVRNQSYTRKSINIRERHNERKNENYSNPDIIPSRSDMNVYFKRCEGTYAQAFDRLVADGIISTRGLKPDANLFDELVFDINTAYFERNGGYDYAKEFYEDVYDLAVEIAGGEQYIISAVMHADERNSSLSDALGRDVYHYHIHVVYVPVVEKEIKWTKRCKDPELVGKVKEVIHQVSHSKKWESKKMTDAHGNILRDEHGKALLVNSYSLLQDRYFEYMHQRGYLDFERGERGSSIEHLTVLDYKIQKDRERSTEIKSTVQTQKQELTVISKELQFKQAAYKTFQELDNTGKRKKLSGKVELTLSEFDDVIALAKEGICSRSIISNLRQKLSDTIFELNGLKQRFDQLCDHTRDFFRAIKLAPSRVKELFEDIFAKDREEREQKYRSRSRTRPRRRNDDLVR